MSKMKNTETELPLLNEIIFYKGNLHESKGVYKGNNRVLLENGESDLFEEWRPVEPLFRHVEHLHSEDGHRVIARGLIKDGEFIGEYTYKGMTWGITIPYPEYIPIDTPGENKNYYLYTGGVLKLVDREGPRFTPAVDSNDHDENDQLREDYDNYIASLPSISVSEDLKRIWKEGQRVEEGKDFIFPLVQTSEGHYNGVDYHAVYQFEKRATRVDAVPVPSRKGQEERTFRLQEMIDCWEASKKYNARMGYTNNPNMEQYFDNKYNIGITTKE